MGWRLAETLTASKQTEVLTSTVAREAQIQAATCRGGWRGLPCWACGRLALPVTGGDGVGTSPSCVPLPRALESPCVCSCA